MAAAEQQGQRVVSVGVFGVGRGTEQFGRRGGYRELFLAGPSRLLAAYLVRQPPRRDRDQPSARVVREPARRPLLRGREQGFLGGVLAQVELPVPAYQRGKDLRREFPEQAFDVAPVRGRGSGQRSGLASCRIGQISTGSTSAKGMSAAIWCARSSLSQSSR